MVNNAFYQVGRGKLDKESIFFLPLCSLRTSRHHCAYVQAYVRCLQLDPHRMIGRQFRCLGVGGEIVLDSRPCQFFQSSFCSSFWPSLCHVFARTLSASPLHLTVRKPGSNVVDSVPLAVADRNVGRIACSIAPSQAYALWLTDKLGLNTCESNTFAKMYRAESPTRTERNTGRFLKHFDSFVSENNSKCTVRKGGANA